MYIKNVAKRYSIVEARANLPGVVNEAVGGASVELTRHGKPVAVVISVEQYELLRGNHVEFKSAYRNFLKKYPLEEFGVDARVWKKVRDRSPGRQVKL
jgi:prevent-host-death family protein